jgi:hypothetical protein
VQAMTIEGRRVLSAAVLMTLIGAAAEACFQMNIDFHERIR